MQHLMRPTPPLLAFTLGAVFLSSASAQSATSRIVRAADTFLGTLDNAQRQRVLFSYDDQRQRVLWSNLPVTMVRRAGLSLADLSDPQRAAVLTHLSTALSKRGYEKVQEIMQGDEMLKRGDSRGMFGKDLYFIAILGKPSDKDPWLLQFGGHHLALNLTIAGPQGILTPSLTAAQPALFEWNGKTIRPLGQENDKAFALLNALDENQRKSAILNYRVADLVLGPGQDGKVIEPEGLKASAMNERQRALLLDVISEWAAIVHDSAASVRMAEIKSGINDTWFAWSGPTDATPGRNGTAYYRIQGPKLVIEYAPQRMGGDASMHIHTIYRDPTNDYGRKPQPK